MNTTITPSELSRINANSHLVDVVITLLRGISVDQSDCVGFTNFGYILPQMIREYQAPSSNLHVSVEAQAMWDSLSSSDINCYKHTDSVIPDNLTQPISISSFKGSERHNMIVRNFTPGKKFKFNDLFIEEHMTSVSDLVKAIKKIFNKYKDSADLKQRILCVLEKTHVARILRTEDRSINKSCHRISSNDLINKSSEECFNQIYNQYYLSADIILK